MEVSFISRSRKPNLMTQNHVIKNMLPKIAAKLGGRGGVGGGIGLVTQQSFIREGSALRSNPLPFYIPFSAEKVPFSSVPSIDRWCPLHNTQFRILGIFTLLNTNKSQNQEIFLTHKLSICQPFWALLQTEMTDFPTLS